MSDLQADEVKIQFEVEAKAIGKDGYEAGFRMDDSFASWWSITRWNLHYRHWRALRMNMRHLVSKVLWRKLWRR